MNKVILMGRLTRDPETRYTADNLVISRYTLAVDRRQSKEAKGPTADFVSCIAFGKSGEFAEKYFHKGIKIVVEGRIATGSYEKEDGTKVYTTDVVIDSQEFAESKSSGNREAADQAAVDNYYGGVATDSNGFVSVPDGIDDELPFG